MNQFTCRDGTCIDLQKVCNMNFDCNDKSDEFYCKTVRLDQREYKKHIPPFTKDEKASVQVGFRIESIGKIDEVEMTFDCKFLLNLKWYDFRLEYMHIYGYHRMLSRESAKEIWLPNLIMTNADGSPDVLESDSYRVHIKMEEKPKLGGRNELHESQIFDGKENSLVWTDVKDAKMNCQQSLITYPFDTQECWIHLRVPNYKQSLVKIIPGFCQSTKEFNLMQFEVKELKIEAQGDNQVSCKITLKRNPSFHLVSTYLPTGTLMVVALATLFIDESHLEVTLMVAITSMLVMFTLHQNVQSKVPYTAYLKFVDYWLIYGTLLPFIVFIVEVAWELGMGDKKNQNQVMDYSADNPPPKNYFKIIPKCGLPLVTLIFTLIYICIAIML